MEGARLALVLDVLPLPLRPKTRLRPLFAGMRRASYLLCLNYLQIELWKEVGMRSVLGLCFRGAKTNTVLHSQAPALHPFARVQELRTNRGQGADSWQRSKRREY